MLYFLLLSLLDSPESVYGAGIAPDLVFLVSKTACLLSDSSEWSWLLGHDVGHLQFKEEGFYWHMDCRGLFHCQL